MGSRDDTWIDKRIEHLVVAHSIMPSEELELLLVTVKFLLREHYSLSNLHSMLEPILRVIQNTGSLSIDD